MVQLIFVNRIVMVRPLLIFNLSLKFMIVRFCLTLFSLCPEKTRRRTMMAP